MNAESAIRLFGHIRLIFDGYATGGFHLVGVKGNYEIHVTYTPEDIQSAVLDSNITISKLSLSAQASIWVNVKIAGITIFDDEVGYKHHLSTQNFNRSQGPDHMVVEFPNRNSSPRLISGSSVIDFPLKKVINA